MKAKSKANIELINSCIEDNVLNIDKLLETKNLETIKYGLNNCPLTLREYLKKLYDKRDWRTLYQWAIDNHENELAEFLVFKESKKLNEDNYVKHMHFERYSPDDHDSFNDIIPKTKYVGVNKDYFYIKTHPHSNVKFVEKEQVIEEILKKFDLQEEKNTLISNLTKEYFTKLFKKKDYELLVIKLCVRLEVVLRCDYYLEGTFEEMLTQYTSKHCHDEKISALLHKLRILRNDIAHPKKNMETMNEEELLKCIEYVFDIG